MRKSRLLRGLRPAHMGGFIGQHAVLRWRYGNSAEADRANRVVGSVRIESMEVLDCSNSCTIGELVIGEIEPS